jgi:hypothetical protein
MKTGGFIGDQRLRLARSILWGQVHEKSAAGDCFYFPIWDFRFGFSRE